MRHSLFVVLLLLAALLPADGAHAQWYSDSGKAPAKAAPQQIDPRAIPQAIPQPQRAIPQQAVPQVTQPRAAVPSGEPVDNYHLGPGDKLRVTVYNEPDLSGEFEVGSSGRVSLPLIGEVSAYKKTLAELEKIVSDRFRDGYLVEPRVSIEVLNFRHFYIMGEVKNPGSYPYVNALNILNAVALAGGYTYRAKDEDMVIFRPMPDGSTQELKVDENTRVLPEDTIKIKERFF